jgi:hypothetical protein
MRLLQEGKLQMHWLSQLARLNHIKYDRRLHRYFLHEHDARLRNATHKNTEAAIATHLVRQYHVARTWKSL